LRENNRIQVCVHKEVSITNQEQKADCYIKLTFDPCWELIQSIREFIERISYANIEKSSFASAAALTASELLENAVKFSSGDIVLLKVSYKNQPLHDAKVFITVENKAEKKHIKRLRSALTEIHKNSPKEAYLKKLKEVMKRSFNDPTSRLGLARINFEASAHCTLEVKKKNVSITAIIANKNI
jgi:ribosome-binding factor A